MRSRGFLVQGTEDDELPEGLMCDAPLCQNRPPFLFFFSTSHLAERTVLTTSTVTWARIRLIPRSLRCRV